MNEETKTETQSNNPLLAETKAHIERLEKAASEAKRQADRLEQLQAQAMLSGSAGMRPNIPQLTEEDLKKKESLEFWKGTAIYDAILKQK